jgi:sulfur carrier protein ThiS
MRISYRDKKWELEGRRHVREVIKNAGLNTQSVLAVRDGRLVTEDVLLEEDDDLVLLAVISGG